MVAGGQGSRLQFFGSKGCFPISVVKHKTLFQLCAEKVLAASEQVGRDLFLAIMTSPSNQEETLSWFEAHHFFGLNREQLFFFRQENLPLLNEKGDLFLESPNTLAEGPDGNGSVFHYFVKSGIWEDWQKKG